LQIIPPKKSKSFQESEKTLSTSSIPSNDTVLRALFFEKFLTPSTMPEV
jgi:hypothetical protein